jgi:hypothetical protein
MVICSALRYVLLWQPSPKETSSFSDSKTGEPFKPIRGVRYKSTRRSSIVGFKSPGELRAFLAWKLWTIWAAGMAVANPHVRPTAALSPSQYPAHRGISEPRLTHEHVKVSMATYGETLPYGNVPAVTGAEGIPDISGRNCL